MGGSTIALVGAQQTQQCTFVAHACKKLSVRGNILKFSGFIWNEQRRYPAAANSTSRTTKLLTNAQISAACSRVGCVQRPCHQRKLHSGNCFMFPLSQHLNMRMAPTQQHQVLQQQQQQF
jgi:hypothetical protein